MAKVDKMTTKGVGPDEFSRDGVWSGERLDNQEEKYECYKAKGERGKQKKRSRGREKNERDSEK